ncbi:carbon-nitrogen hydrolase family protein [Candidatus Sumerlaeota bacterium]|nr:carbon-nitrogen hydrolase family protein [Candidatus Sumerlaeota bacterium]
MKKKNDPLRLRVGAVQMHCEMNLSRNAAAILAWIEQAAERQAQLIVFPECALTGYPLNRRQHRFKEASAGQINSAMQLIRAKAEECNMAVAVGSAWPEGGVWFNRSWLIAPTGHELGYYDKTHLMPLDEHCFQPGEAFHAWKLLGVKTGMLICKDHRYPEAWRAMKRRGAQVVCHLSAAYGDGAWKLPVLEGVLRARASENGFFIVSANDAGAPQMLQSAIYDPEGLILAQANYCKEELITAEISLDRVRKGFPPREPEFYQ